MKLFKHSIVLGAFACSIGFTPQVHAQNALSVQVNRQASIQQPESYALFTLSAERSIAIDKSIHNVTYLSLNKAQLKSLLDQNENLVSFSIPVTGGKEIPFQLMKYDFRTGDYRSVVKTGSGYSTVEPIEGHFYRGAIKGMEFSLAAFSFYEEEIGAVFSNRENGNYNLVLNKENPGAQNENYILYREDDIIDKTRGTCALTEDVAAITKSASTGTVSGMGVFETDCKTVRISVFADYLVYQRCTSSVVKTLQYMNTLFNVISALYANDRLFLNLSETIVSTIDEGYDYSTSRTVLTDFGNLVQTYTYNGDIAHFMTGYRNSAGYAPLGGLAWLDVMCISPVPAKLSGADTYYGPYSMGNTNVMTSIPSLPTYSWDVEVTAHELGHNIGSPHTQSCTWPGGPIDDCVAPEGGCSSTGTTPTSGGTVMSYCHLKAGVGINFANGFGPLPTALLKDEIVSASCLRSGLSDSTLKTANKTVIANAECYDGVWSHYFFDNNTSDLSDDIMVLSLAKGSLDIGNISDAGFVLKMTTNTYYAKDTVPDLTVAYADTNWHEINRKWTIQLPAGKQPKVNVKARYPFMDQDVKDIAKVLLPKVIKDTNLVFLKYANSTPVTSFPSTTTADVRRITNNKIVTSSVKDWYSGSEGAYKYAEVMLDSGVYGGTLGYQLYVAPPPPVDTSTSINDASLNRKINIYPNPAGSTIRIEAPSEYTGAQQVFLYDNLGRVVYQQQTKFVNRQMTIDVSMLNSGVYTIKCISTLQSSMLSGVFIKQ